MYSQNIFQKFSKIPKLKDEQEFRFFLGIMYIRLFPK